MFRSEPGRIRSGSKTLGEFTVTPIQAIARQRVRDVVKRYGPAWSRIGREFQEGAIAKEFASIVIANANTTNPDASAHYAETYREMMRAAFGDED